MTKRVVLVLAVLFGLALMVAGQSPLAPFRRGETGIDSSVFKYVAIEMSDGKVPYKDTFDHKGPLLYIINFLGNMISYYRGVWLFELLAIFLTLVAFYKIARLVQLEWYYALIAVFIAACPLCVFCSDNSGNYAQEYALPLIAWSFYVFLGFFKQKSVSKLALIGCGFALGGAFLLQANMVMPWVVFSVAVAIDAIRHKQSKQLVGWIGYFLLGFLIMVVPILGWLAIRGALADYIYCNFTFNALYSTVDDGLPAATAALHYFNHPLMIASFGYLCCLLTKERERFLHGVYMCVFLVLLVSANMSGRLYEHYQIVTVPSLVYPLAMLFNELGREKKSRLLLLTIGILVTMVAAPDWINAGEDESRFLASHSENQFSRRVSDVTNYIRDHSTEEDKISVYGNWNVIYILSERRSASKYSYQFDPAAVEPRILAEYLEELEKNQPKFIVLEPLAFSGGGRKEDEAMYDFLMTHDYVMIWEEQVSTKERGAVIYQQRES